MSYFRDYIQPYAMFTGTFLGGFWILKFIFFPLGLSHSFLLFVFLGLTLCAPFMGYRLTRMFRDNLCQGSISFGRAWLFHQMMYLFAAMLVAVAHFVYFRFIDQGFVIAAYQSQLDVLAQSPVAELRDYAAAYGKMLDQARRLTPIDITLQMISSNVMAGAFIGIPVALLVRRKKKTDLPPQ